MVTSLALRWDVSRLRTVLAHVLQESLMVVRGIFILFGPCRALPVRQVLQAPFGLARTTSVQQSAAYLYYESDTEKFIVKIVNESS